MPPHASALVTYGISGLAVFVGILFALGLAITDPSISPSWWRRFLLTCFCVAVVMTAISGLALSKALTDFESKPPPIAVFFILVLIGSVALGLSPVGRRFSKCIPIGVLILAQGFRFPLELVMHQAAREGVMPMQMSYSGMNFDIVTGLGALVVGFLAMFGKAPRGLMIAWNFGGLLLLANIIILAIVSMPFLHAFGAEPERLNTWVAYLPFVWLPGVLVPAAIFGHIVITRKLLPKPQPEQLQ